jgi:hypothetical protein
LIDSKRVCALDDRIENVKNNIQERRPVALTQLFSQNLLLTSLDDLRCSIEAMMTASFTFPIGAIKSC